MGRARKSRSAREDGMSSLSIFIVGFIIVIAGLAYGANLAGMPPQWIGVGAVVLAGIGIVMGVSRTRMKDPSHD
jgi:uncharacterized protein (DUF983 family)